jgi:hypothetical protein
MQDRLRAARQAAAQLAERTQRFRPGGSSDDETTGDDEADEELPALEAEPDHEDLARLDDEDAAPIAIDADRSLFELLRQIDPTPPVPLTAVHEVGFVSLLRRLGEVADTGLLEDSRARRILDLVGDRLSISAGPDGITVRSLVRRRHTPWSKVQRLTLGGRYDLLRGDGLAKLVEDVKSRMIPIPIPGLSWLLRRVVGGIANWLEQKFFTEDQIEALRGGVGNAVLGIQRRGFDIELSGPLLLVSILAPGLSEAVEQEARARGIEIEVSDGGPA